MIENVEGLFNSNGGRDFGVILQRMTQLGYAVAWRLVNSRYFGVPQSRSRVYLCCWQKDLARATHVMFDSVGAHSTSNAPKFQKLLIVWLPLLVDIPEPTGAAHILYVMMAFAE